MTKIISNKFDCAIIDMDPLIYRCGFAVESYNKEENIIEIEPVHHAYYNINSMMGKILQYTKDSKFKGYLTASNDRTNFRFDIFPKYKDNRKDARKPVYYNELREFMINRYEAEVVSGEEADDRCSIEHCKLNNLGFDKDVFNSVVCSFDKDFNNIPGWHYNYVKDELYFVDELQALRNFYLQILTGDPSDGIPRIKKGWRQKDAELALIKADNEKDMISIVHDELVEILDDTSENSTLKQQVQEILIDRGRLVWLRREDNEMWSY